MVRCEGDFVVIPRKLGVAQLFWETSLQLGDGLYLR